MQGPDQAFTELDFETADHSYPAVQLSAELHCRVDGFTVTDYAAQFYRFSDGKSAASD